MSTQTVEKQATKSGHFRNDDGSLKKKRILGHSVSILGAVAAFLWDPFMGICTAVGGQAVAWYDEVMNWIKTDPYKLAEVRKSLKGLGFKQEQVTYLDKTLSHLFKEYDKFAKCAVENAYVAGNFDRTKQLPTAAVDEHKSKLLATMDQEKKRQMAYVEGLLREAAEMKAAA